MVYKIALVGIFFEIAQALRIVLIIKQEHYWKINDPKTFNLIYSLYLMIGEVFSIIIFIIGVYLSARKLKKKHLSL